jgi:glycosyltransferase involved in cell wall biosynthesis
VTNSSEKLDAREIRSAHRARSEPFVTILVPCRNEREHIIEFLRSLEQQEPVEGGHEILIIDGISDDGTRELLAKYAPELGGPRIVDNPARIVSPGLNEGIRQARGEIILRMDVHTTYAPDYVKSCLRVLQTTGATNVGGPARTRSVGYWQRAIAAAFASAFAVGPARFHFESYEGEVDTVTYGCWRKSDLLRIGGFDESLVRNQDDELNFRIRRSGGIIWQSPEIQSWYYPRSRLSDLFRQYFQYGYWKLIVMKKHRIPASWRHLMPPLFLVAIIGLGLASIFQKYALIAWLALILSYCGFLVVGSLSISARSGWRLLPAILPTLAVYHFSYAIGIFSSLLPLPTRLVPKVAKSLSR